MGHEAYAMRHKAGDMGYEAWGIGHGAGGMRHGLRPFHQARVIAHCASFSYSLGPRPARVCKLLVSPYGRGAAFQPVGYIPVRVSFMYGPVYISATYLRRATLSVLPRRRPGKV